MYVANNQYGLIQIWLEGSSNLTYSIISNSSAPEGLFVHTSGDIYLDNRYLSNRVDVWSINASIYSATLDVGAQCTNIFIDKNDSLYCSMYSDHRVIKRSLNSSDGQLTVVAGSDCFGMASNMLYHPYGIFVDTNFDLYVADCYNHRIQRFLSGQLSAVTVAGSNALQTIDLSYPTSVLLDADGYLFIVDSNNHRIVGSGPTGFRCVVGCSGTQGSGSNQLSSPRTMAFDSHGNIFIVDHYNSRVQQFFLLRNSCSKYGIIFNA